MLTRAELKTFLQYEPETGIFTRLVTTSPQGRAGDVAGCVDTKGYIAIRVKSKRHRAHRLAWLYMTGRFPSEEIDHVNRIRNDNRWANLREATSKQNKQNRSAQRENQSGEPGVRKNTCGSKWTARIQADGQRLCLGSFGTAKEASAAYRSAKARWHAFNREQRT